MGANMSDHDFRWLDDLDARGHERGPMEWSAFLQSLFKAWLESEMPDLAASPLAPMLVYNLENRRIEGRFPVSTVGCDEDEVTV